MAGKRAVKGEDGPKVEPIFTLKASEEGSVRALMALAMELPNRAGELQALIRDFEMYEGD